MTSSSNFFDVVLFLLSHLVTGPSFMSISSLVLELWQFSFVRYLTEIRKSKIPPSEFCPVSGDWGKLGIPNLTQMSLTKCYWMLQSARVTAFTVSEFLRENQQEGGGKITPLTPHIQIRVKNRCFPRKSAESVSTRGDPNIWCSSVEAQTCWYYLWKIFAPSVW